MVLLKWGRPLELGGAGCVWFGPAWVVRVVWGQVWWGSVAEWAGWASMGAAWLGVSIV